ncbi:hypothetical protein Q2941_32480 [Bradyrhizobium sp. UFLA05-153]
MTRNGERRQLQACLKELQTAINEVAVIASAIGNPRRRDAARIETKLLAVKMQLSELLAEPEQPVI